VDLFKCFFARDKMAIDFDIFFEIYNVCSRQDSLLSMITPKNFDFGTTSSCWLLILILISDVV
jgi:hypothetical protein